MNRLFEQNIINKKQNSLRVGENMSFMTGTIYYSRVITEIISNERNNPEKRNDKLKI